MQLDLLNKNKMKCLVKPARTLYPIMAIVFFHSTSNCIALLIFATKERFSTQLWFKRGAMNTSTAVTSVRIVNIASIRTDFGSSSVESLITTLKECIDNIQIVLKIIIL